MLSYYVLWLVSFIAVYADRTNTVISTLGWPQDDTEIMQISSNYDFVVVILLPVHQSGSNVFECGEVNKNSDLILNQLSMIGYGFEVAKEEAILLTGVTLGAYVIDYCSQPMRAFNSLFQLLVGRSNTSSNIVPRSVVSVITVENAVTDLVRPLLRSLQVPLISTSLRPGWDEPTSELSHNDLQLSVDTFDWIRAVGDFLEAAHIEFISVLYSSNEYGTKAKETLTSSLKDTCIVKSFELSSESELRSLTRHLLALSEGHVILLLVDDEQITRNFFNIYAGLMQNTLQVFIVNDQVLSRKYVQRLEISILLIGAAPDFDKNGYLEYVSQLDLRQHKPIKDDWFQELWQRYFQCSLSPTSSWPLCTGHESLNQTISFSTSLDYTFLAIKTASDGFQNFLTRHCKQRDRIRTIDDCGQQARSFLSTETRKALLGDKLRGQRPLATNTEGIEFLLYYRDTNLMVQQPPRKVAIWHKGTIELSADASSQLRRAGIVDLPCIETCAESCPEKAARKLASNMDLTYNFRLTWGLVTASMSALGIVAVIACFFYFVAVIPNSKGTTILSYVILFGIFAIYGVNFAFIATATEVICAARRFIMGVGYAIVFSAKLVKVVDIWRRSRKDAPVASSCVATHQQAIQDQAKPSFILLISLSVAFFQAGIAAAWLVLVPPDLTYQMAHARCSPGEKFEEDLVISMVYVMLLMVMTFGFSIATWKSETHHRESRWILLSTVLNCCVWLLWTLVATQAEVANRNPAIVIANIVCATIVLLCLYGPKVYLYTKLLKQAKKLDIRAFYPKSYRGQQAVSTLYDPLPHGSVNSIYSTLTGTLTTTTNSERRPKKNEKERRDPYKSMSQQELFPRPVYDGRSQFLVEQRSTIVSPRISAIHDLPPPRALRNHNNEAAYF